MGSEQLTADERNRQVLLIFAEMERARKAGRTMRLPWRDLHLIWTVFGSVMNPAAVWAAGSTDEDKNPRPDLPAMLAEIASGMAVEQTTGRSALSTTTKGKGHE